MDNRRFKKTHGMSRPPHPIYNAWLAMRKRCQNPKNHNYLLYGGRGINVCDRWSKFENFRDDMLPFWKSGLSLDRINVDGNYEPGNCRWATLSEQGKNKRNKAELQSQFPGVSWSKSSKQWKVIKAFKTQEEAEAFFLKVNSK